MSAKEFLLQNLNTFGQIPDYSPLTFTINWNQTQPVTKAGEQMKMKVTLEQYRGNIYIFRPRYVGLAKSTFERTRRSHQILSLILCTRPWFISKLEQKCIPANNHIHNFHTHL